MGEKEEHSTKVPLLTDGELEQSSSSKGTPLHVCLLRWAFKSLMWFIFITWVLLIFAYPSESVDGIVTSLFVKAQHTVFGLAGGTFLVFSGPIILLAALAYVYIGIFSREEDYEKKKRSKIPRLRLWTFPVIVDGPFGVVSAAEFVGIFLVAAYVLWTVSAYAIQIHHSVTESPFPSLPGSASTAWVLDRLGLKFGSIGVFLLGLLFLPIARGSVLLRLIDVPFEHATRYHVWLGHLTMVVFTLHGVFYMSSWSISKCFVEKILEWRAIGVANLAGVISLFAGLLMWVTSLHPVRKAYFELFFYTHQLYVVFIVFFALHIGDFIYSIAAGGIFLFVLDRFLRFCQSRTKVDVISAACLPCGTVEIVLAKPPNLRYNALSFIFLQVRELSWLQWHPFSVSSSPLDGENHMSILIKVLGQWTARLRDIIISSTEHGNKVIAASVEGPYGHELPYHLEYEHLILVAGGIGISPFLAILSDVIQRIHQNKANCLPKNILVVWAVKNSQELSLISSINHLSVSPSFSHKLNLDIQAYVTQESEPPLEDGLLHKNIDKAPIRSINIQKRMSSLVGTGNNVFAGAYFAISTIGFIALYTLLQVVYVQPFMVSTWWLLGLLLMSCMVASVLLFGGMVVFLWYHWEKKRELNNGASMLGYEEKQPKGNKEFPVCDAASKVNLHTFMNTQYGHRPNFQGIFSRFSEQVGHVDVGVMVCGPKTLQSSVAKECRTQNIRGNWNYPIFHFHSHSFDL